MAGIAPQPQGPEEIGDEEGMPANVSPEEQEQYEEFVVAGMALIYQKKGGAEVRPGILKLLDDDPSDLKAILSAEELDQFSPLVAIAATTVVVALEILQLAGPENKPDDDVIFHGGAAILQELCQIWMHRNPDQPLEEDDVHKALTMAADIYREAAADAGLVDENALSDQFQMLVQADKQGRLAEVSPELAGINRAAEINMEQGDEEAPAEEAQ